MSIGELRPTFVDSLSEQGINQIKDNGVSLVPDIPLLLFILELSAFL